LRQVLVSGMWFFVVRGQPLSGYGCLCRLAGRGKKLKKEGKGNFLIGFKRGKLFCKFWSVGWLLRDLH